MTDITKYRNISVTHAVYSDLSWLGGNSRDFRFVCELAGREPSYVRERIQKQLTEREAYFASLQESYPYRNLSNV